MSESKYVGALTTGYLLEEIDRCVRGSRYYINRSDFVRRALMRELEHHKNLVDGIIRPFPQERRPVMPPNL